MGRKAHNYKKGRPRAGCERCDGLPAEIFRGKVELELAKA